MREVNLGNITTQRLDSRDNRNLNEDLRHANFPGRGMFVDFKDNSAVRLWQSNSGFCTLMTVKPWTDQSGGHGAQLAFTENGNMFIRSGGWDGWSGWRQIQFVQTSPLNQPLATTETLPERDDKQKRGFYLDLYRKYQAAVNYGEIMRCSEVDLFIQKLKNKDWSAFNEIPKTLLYFKGEI